MKITEGKKTLCILSGDYPSEGRPTFVFVEQLVNALVDLGIDVSVVAPQSLVRSYLRKIPLLPRINSYTTPKGNKYLVYRPYSLTFGKGKRMLYSLFSFYNSHNLKSCLNKIAPDILYGHFWHNADKLKNYARKNKLPLFVACGEGDDALEEYEKSLNKKDKLLLSQLINGVICVSTENKRKCLSYKLAGENDIIVLPNAVDTNLFYPRPRNEYLRKKIGVKKDDFLLLFVGGFIPRKGCGVLARALNSLKDNRVKVIFAGAPLKGDEDNPECEGMVFKGQVPHKQLPAFYASADAFVLPTLKEGCCNAIVEALSSGLPVISSNRPFNDDLLNENNSILIDPESVEELKIAIKQLVNDRWYYENLKANAVANSADYSIDKRAKLIWEFIRSKS